MARKQHPSKLPEGIKRARTFLSLRPDLINRLDHVLVATGVARAEAVEEAIGSWIERQSDERVEVARVLAALDGKALAATKAARQS